MGENAVWRGVRARRKRLHRLPRGPVVCWLPGHEVRLKGSLQSYGNQASFQAGNLQGRPVMPASATAASTIRRSRRAFGLGMAVVSMNPAMTREVQKEEQWMFNNRGSPRKRDTHRNSWNRCARRCAHGITAPVPSRPISTGSGSSSSTTMSVTRPKWPKPRSTPSLPNWPSRERSAPPPRTRPCRPSCSSIVTSSTVPSVISATSSAHASPAAFRSS